MLNHQRDSVRDEIMEIMEFILANDQRSNYQRIIGKFLLNNHAEIGMTDEIEDSFKKLIT